VSDLPSFDFGLGDIEFDSELFDYVDEEGTNRTRNIRAAKSDEAASCVL